jgi:hypothetical protein
VARRQAKAAEKRGKESDDKEPPAASDIADAIEARHHFAQDDGHALYVYRDGAYRRNGDEMVRREVKAHLKGLNLAEEWSRNLANEVIEYIRVTAPTLWDSPPTDAST